MKPDIKLQMDELNALLCRMLWSQLQTAGFFDGTEITLGKLKTKNGISDLYSRWLEESIAVLIRNHYLKNNGSSYSVIDPAPINIETEWQEWERRISPLREDPNLKAQINLVEATLRVLPEILIGKIFATDIMFPNSSMKLVEGIYKNNIMGDRFNEILANTVSAYIQERLAGNPAARINIIEIGAGTGGTSTMVFQKLKPYREHIQEYCYTDISKAFLIHAETEYGPENPYLTYHIFNVEAPIIGQGIKAGGYDIAIAANVLHATKNIHQTIRNAKATLKKNGLLLLNEISHNSIFAHLTFGLLEGWWLFEDSTLRIPGSPALAPATWQTVLEQEGFRLVFFPAQTIHDLGQQVIGAESDGVIYQKEPAQPNIIPLKKKITAKAMSKNFFKQKTVSTQDKGVSVELLREKSTLYIKKLVGETLKIPAHKIDSAAPLETYGIDSILIVQLTNQLSKILTNINSTLFFEYQTIDALVEHFIQTQKDSLNTLLGLADRELEEELSSGEEKIVQSSPMRPNLSSRSSRRFLSRDNDLKIQTPKVRDVAIIGLSGRYPGADNVNEYWRNLAAGRNCICEIPKERWDWRKYYDEEKGKWGTIYTKWGGFITDVDKFDPLFFQISPKEAEEMDPQERVFLEEVYASIEDAGYTPATLCDSRKVGVFVGVMNADYPTGASYWSVANRVSYLMNFQGPSIAMDTACSSSLIAIHFALESLYNGTSDFAIAGGVNLINDPKHYLRQTSMGMLSAGNQCKAFGDGADGIVVGEGVGAVILKPLDQAITDNDHIYGILKGSMVNAGGKTNGYTVPNPVAQRALIRAALKRSGVNARAVSYIEAHGTGTSLGDPIEIAGLTQAFREDTEEVGYCAIGSAKTSIGHLESAAGIAGLTKVLLQMKHRKLAPSLHSEVLNPNIDFSNTPFLVQQELTEWKRPIIELNSTRQEYPRIAGISSFGAGGSNAHVVIEEYVPENQELSSVKVTPRNPAVIILSAKDEDRLKERAQLLLTAIEEQQLTDADLASIAYTLQVGRETMEERLGVIIGSIEELAFKLAVFLAGQDAIDNLYRGQVNRNQEAWAVFNADEDLQKAVESWISKGKHGKILDLWVKGLVFDWNRLYGDIKPQRISLPTYPFAKERYWAPETNTIDIRGRVSLSTGGAAYIHPLLQQNTSNFTEQRYSSTFTGEEFFLVDHKVNMQKILPGVVYLEMVRAAVMEAAGVLPEDRKTVKIKNLIWARPVLVNEEPVQVHIGLFPGENGEITFEIYSPGENTEDEVIIYSRGNAILVEVTENPVLDLKALQAECGKPKTFKKEIYDMFASIGFQYGPGHQGIESISMIKGLVLAKLSLPSCIAQNKEKYMLHPSLMDAALQASIAITAGETDNKTTSRVYLPFALQELEIYRDCTSNMWSVIRYSKGSTAADSISKLDIDVCDEQGNVCVSINGYSSKLLEGDFESTSNQMAAIEKIILEPVWHDQAIVNDNDEREASIYKEWLVILCEPGEISPEAIEKEIHGVRCLCLETEQKSIIDRYQTYVLQIFEEIKKILAGKLTGKILIQLVVTGEGERQLFTGLSGMLRTVQLENPNVIGQVIEIETIEDIANITVKIKENARLGMDSQIHYHEGKRQVTGWSEVKASSEATKIPWKDGGVYLITGGAGGLGKIFAKEIMKQVKDAILVLTGRSSFDENRQSKLKELEANGAKVIYKAVDVSDRNAVDQLIANVITEFGKLNGIIHSAGLIHDNYIGKKTKEEIIAVLAPKLPGLVHLDQVTRNLKLDFMILFSSWSGSVGTAGQADYSVANAFLDVYARYRNNLVALKKRHGKTLSINWPYWKDGGIRMDENIVKMVSLTSGMVPMETKTGIWALYQGMICGKDQVMVVEGDIRKIQESLAKKPVHNEKANQTSSKPKLEITTSAEQKELLEKTSDYIKKLLAPVFRLKVDRFDADTPLEKYGFNSIIVMQLNIQLEKKFGSLSKTLFYEYKTIRELSGYFLESHREQLNQLMGIGAKEAIANTIDTVAVDEPVMTAIHSHKRSRFTTLQPVQASKTNKSIDIAIIGVSGRYPGARNPDEFWEILRDGKDCITEVPKDRWDHSRYFDEDKTKPGKTYSQWGGFLEGVAEFDPLFFNISPREAELMDPQERLYLETVWGLLEDTGYTRDNLKSIYQSRIGVFVGAMEGISSIANRVSFYFDFQGPSITINTLCSSSGVAIHMACESLIHGECRMAIAGGVNLVIHPQKYIGLSLAQMLGSHPNSRSFGDGDGYLPAEGVGTVLLKPLAQAIQDRDNILAVIKSTATNHGGHTNGYMVPNPILQAQLIQDNFRKSGIEPRTISYVESAALGSALGDPIEITALTKAFGQFTEERQFCAIGSVKSNIGHPEAASGISQLTKVILQLQHQQLVPSIKAEPLNPNISFEHTPFYLQRELQEWKRPVIRFGDQEQEFPRRATISSFGAGGSNVHLIVEEYIPAQAGPVPTPEVILPQIVILSAKNKERLQAVGQQILDFVERQKEISLLNLAYTLQVGREAMDFRVAMVVNSIAELIQGLKVYLGAMPDNQGNGTFIPLFTGESEINQFEFNHLLSGKTGETLLQSLLEENNLEKLAQYWVSGGKIPWESLHKNTQAQKISLPTYPFTRESYWISYDKAENHPVRLVQPSRSEIGHENIQDYLINYISQELNLATDKMKINQNIGDYGVNSITITKMLRDIENRFGIKISGREMLELKTIGSIATYLTKKIALSDHTQHIQNQTERLKIKTSTSTENIDDLETEILEKLRNGIITLEEAKELI